MADPVNESERGSPRLYFDHRVKLEFHGPPLWWMHHHDRRNVFD